MTDERIFVTGAGAATAFGLGVEVLHDAMLAGTSAVAPLPEPQRALRPGYGALVTLGARDIRKLPNSRDMRPGTMTRYTFLSTLGLGSAMLDGDLPFDDGDGAQRRGLYVASYTNSDRFDKYVRFAHHLSGQDDDGAPTIIDSNVPQAIRKFSSFEFLKLMNNMPAAHGGIHGRCQGPCNTFLGTPAGGVQAIGRAALTIRDGLADTMYAGGTGSSAHPQMMITRATRGLASDASVDPASAGRPFDRAATGIVPGEAGAMLCLERETTAKARGADMSIELAGYGEWFIPPADRDGVPASPAGTIRAARRALEMAGVEAGDVDVVMAHGESGNDLDRLEAMALAELLGPRAGDVPVVTTTAHLGSVEAAIGPLQTALATRILATGQVPGALNRTDPIDEYKGPAGPDSMQIDASVALISITTREGVSAALVLRKA